MSAVRAPLRLPGVLFGRAATAIATPRSSSKRPVARDISEGLRVYTFVNDDAVYAEMVKSFVAAGFPEQCFTRLSEDDETPFGLINAISGEADCRYTVVCHQDLLADRGDGLDELLEVLADLDRQQPYWIVAGNAGVARDGRVVRHIYDVFGGPASQSVPCPVVTLDENFLVLNMRYRPRTTPGLSGFHLYGTDLCLNALEDGGTCHVIDFLVTHVGGSTGGVVPPELIDRLTSAWDQRCRARYVFTLHDVLFVSRSRFLRKVLGSRRARAWVRRYRSVR